MNVLEDSSLLFRVAKYYYINNYSQDEIAKLENISRPQISRLLKKARDVGIVKIDVSMPNTLERGELQAQLQSILHLKKVVISPSTEGGKENSAGVYSITASYLSEVLRGRKNVGIGWGKTIYNTSLQLALQDEHNELTFYPVIGNSGTNIPFYQINNIIDRFAEKFRANAYYTHSLFLQPKTIPTDLDIKRLNVLKQYWKNLDAIIIGLGGRVISKAIYIDELPPSVNKKQLVDHAIGDILANFFLDDETFFEYPKDYRLIAIDLKDLKQIEEIICIAHGRHKVEAIVYAANNKYFNTLITDDLTARAVLDYSEKKQS